MIPSFDLFPVEFPSNFTPVWFPYQHSQFSIFSFDFLDFPVLLVNNLLPFQTVLLAIWRCMHLHRFDKWANLTPPSPFSALPFQFLPQGSGCTFVYAGVINRPIMVITDRQTLNVINCWYFSELFYVSNRIDFYPRRQRNRCGKYACGSTAISMLIRSRLCYDL